MDSQDSIENINQGKAQKKKKRDHKRQPGAEISIDSNKDVEVGRGLRGGIEKGRKGRPKREFTKIEVHVLEMDKTTGFKIQHGKYRTMQEVIEDLMEHIGQQAEVPWISEDRDSRFMLIDPVNQGVINEIGKLRHGHRYQFVHVRDYRKRDRKKMDKEVKESEDDGDMDDSEEDKGSKDRLFDAIGCGSVKSEPEGRKAVYVGPGSNLPKEIKNETNNDRASALGNLIQGSYGMGLGTDKLSQFSQTHSHLIQKLAPGYLNQSKYDAYGTNFQQTKMEQMNISGTNYSIALTHFVLSFKMANDILVMEPGEDNFFSSISEDPRDILEYMTLFQEYLKIGWDLQKVRGPESLTKWEDQKKVLRILGHNSQVVRNELMKEVRSKHSYETPNSKELIFTVAKTKEELKELMLKYSNKRGYRIVSETWHDPKGNTQNLQFWCGWKGRGVEGELLKWRFYLRFKYISDKFWSQYSSFFKESDGRFIIEEYQLLHCHPINEKVEKLSHLDENNFLLDKMNNSEKQSVEIQWDINIDRSLDKLYLYNLVTNKSYQENDLLDTKDTALKDLIENTAITDSDCSFSLKDELQQSKAILSSVKRDPMQFQSVSH